MINIYIISIFIIILALIGYLYYQNKSYFENFIDTPCPSFNWEGDIYYPSYEYNQTYQSKDSDGNLIMYDSFSPSNGFTDDFKYYIIKFSATRDAFNELISREPIHHFNLEYKFTAEFSTFNKFNDNTTSNYFEMTFNSLYNNIELFKLTYHKNLQQGSTNNQKLLKINIDSSLKASPSVIMDNLPYGMCDSLTFKVISNKKKDVYNNIIILNLSFINNIYPEKQYCFILPNDHANFFFPSIKNIVVTSSTGCPFFVKTYIKGQMYTEFGSPKLEKKMQLCTLLASPKWDDTGKVVYTGDMGPDAPYIHRPFSPGYLPFGDVTNRSETNWEVMMIKPDGIHAIPAERLEYLWSNRRNSARFRIGNTISSILPAGYWGKVLFYRVKPTTKTIKEIDPETNELVDKTYRYFPLADYSIVIPKGARPNIYNVVSNQADDDDFSRWMSSDLDISGGIVPGGAKSLENLPVLIREDCLEPYTSENVLIARNEGTKKIALFLTPKFPEDGAVWLNTYSWNPIGSKPGFPGFDYASYAVSWDGWTAFNRPPNNIDEKKYIIKEECFQKQKKKQPNIKQMDNKIEELRNKYSEELKKNIEIAEKLNESSFNQVQTQISTIAKKNNDEMGLSKNLYNTTILNNNNIAKEVTDVQNYYDFLSGRNKPDGTGFNTKLNTINNKINLLKIEKDRKLTKNQIDNLTNKNNLINEGTKSKDFVDQSKVFDDQLNIYRSMSVFQTLLPERKQFAIQY